MNPSDSNPHDPRDDDQQALDRLIRDVLAAESASGEHGDALRVARLTRFWADQSARERAVGWRWRVAAAAAAVLLAVVTAGWVAVRPAAVATPDQAALPEPTAGRGPAAEDDAGPAAPTEEGPAGLPATRPEPAVVASAFARAPTEYERWMFAAQTRTPAPVVAPVLVEAGDPPLTPADKAAALARVADPSNWPAVVGGVRDPAVRGALAGRLLDDAGEPALIAFVALLRDASTRGAALNAADAREHLPIDRFVLLVDHTDAEVRLAASMALGLLNRCEMTDALITRVEARPSRSKEAWFALLGCRCESAASFLSRAATSPKLLGQLNNARIQFGRTWPVWNP